MSHWEFSYGTTGSTPPFVNDVSIYADQWFVDLKVHQSHQASPAVTDSVGPKWGPGICPSKKFQGDVDAASLGDHIVGTTDKDHSY